VYWLLRKYKIVRFEYVFVVLLVLFVSFISLRANINMDEIWTYQFARRISAHQVPYRDFFMIVSPLKAQIDSVLLRIYSDQLIVLRGFTLMIAFLNGFLWWQVSVKLGLSKANSYFLVCLYYFSFSYLPINNYNWLCLLFVTYLLFLLIFDKEKYPAFLIGLITALLLLTKQNIGLYMLFAIISHFWMTRYPFSLYSLLGFMVGLVPEIIYFLIRGALKNFLQIFYSTWIPFFKTYSKWNPHLLIILLLLLLFFSFTLILISTRKNIQINSTSRLIILFILVVLGFSFPIFDFIHFSFVLPFLFLFILLNMKSTTKILLWIIICFLVFRGFSWFNSIKNSVDTNFLHLNAIPIDRELVYSIAAVTDFENEQITQGNHPYVIDYKNVLFDVVMNRFGLKYDSMLKGNFGISGEQGLINMIATDRKAVVIIHKNYSNQKEQTAITEYVKTHLQKKNRFWKDI